MKVFCDNCDCMFIDEDGFCDCDKLNIVGGVCEGSYHGSRNLTENDVNGRFKTENAKLRELLSRTWQFANRAHEAAYELCPDKGEPHAMATIGALTLNAQDIAVRMVEMGIEVGE